MVERKFKHAVYVATVTVFAMMPLIDCTGDGTEKTNAIQTRFSAGSSGPDNCKSLLGTAGEDVPDITPLAVAELRHFDIYNRYRNLFDAPSNGMPDGVNEVAAFDEQVPARSLDEQESGYAFSACTVRALLMQD